MNDLSNNLQTPLKIILAEDDEDDAYFITQAFDRTNFDGTITLVENGRQVWEAVNRSPEKMPDLLILDLNLPVMSGHEIMQKLNEHPIYKKIPRVVLSTSNQSPDIIKSKELGCLAYYQKPINLSAYESIAREILTHFISR